MFVRPGAMTRRLMTWPKVGAAAAVVLAILVGAAILPPFFDTPPPPPTPLAIPVDAFRGQYYDNEDLTNKTVERIDDAINFNWGSGSPDPAISPDTFSVRWEGYWDLATADA